MADVCFPPAARAALPGRIVGGEHISDVRTDLGVTVHRARGYGRHAPAWARAPDLALRAGRDPDLRHGSRGSCSSGWSHLLHRGHRPTIDAGAGSARC